MTARDSNRKGTAEFSRLKEKGEVIEEVEEMTEEREVPPVEGLTPPSAAVATPVEEEFKEETGRKIQNVKKAVTKSKSKWGRKKTVNSDRDWGDRYNIT
jgi:biotin synthase-related radical SAM superfamily protein